ncbi:MAG: AbrB family transcriptional regulator [Elainellaceae cyanobacterium]
MAVPLGLLLSNLWQGGIAWILGGILAGGVVLYGSRLVNLAAKPNPTARKMGQSLVGMTIGFSIAHSQLADVATNLPVLVLLTGFLLLSGTGIGYLYARFSQTNLLTAMLATVPGGVGIMSSLAADYGRNVALVSLVQIIRVTTVIILIPFVARSAVQQQVFMSTTHLPLIGLEPLQLGYLALALGFTGLTTLLATHWRFPSAPFVGGLVAGGLFNSSIHGLVEAIVLLPAIDFSPPPLVSLLGQILLGVTIGEYWGNKPIVDKRAIGFALVSVTLTLTAGLAAMLLAMQLTHWDWLTCLLVTAPGGAAEMILVALSLNHHVETVTAGHLVRLIAINASLPLWVFLFRTLDRQLGQPQLTSVR